MKYKKECLIIIVSVACGAVTFAFDIGGSKWVGNAIAIAASVCAILYLSSLYFFDILGFGAKSQIINQTDSEDSCEVIIKCCENEFGKAIHVMDDSGLYILARKGESVKVRIKRGQRIFTVFQFKQAQSNVNLIIDEGTSLFVWSENSVEGKPFKMAYSVDDDDIRRKKSYCYHKSRKNIFLLLYILAIVVIIGMNVAMNI